MRTGSTPKVIFPTSTSIAGGGHMRRSASADPTDKLIKNIALSRVAINAVRDADTNKQGMVSTSLVEPTIGPVAPPPGAPSAATSRTG